MDWTGIERDARAWIEESACAIDRDQRVRILNAAAEELLGRTSDAVAGQEWWTALGVTATATQRRALVAAFAGTPQSFDVEQRRAGLPSRRWTLTVRQSAATPDAAIAIIVDRDARRPLLPPDLSACADYEVRTTEADFGALIRVGERTARAGTYCYQQVFGRDAPCDDCPVRGAKPRPAVVRRTETGFYSIAVRSSRPESARLQAHFQSRAEWLATCDAELDALASAAGLSPRERSVLGHLVRGRSLEQMAAAVGVTERTVRFHQANVLEKLKVPSRLALFELLFR